MLIGLCSIFDVISLLPYAWLLTLPLYGAFCGIEACTRLSLIMCLYAVLTSIIPNDLGILSAVVNFCILLGVLLLPIGGIPHILITCYHHMLWLSEMPLLFVDCIQLVHTSMTISYTLVTDYMEHWPNFTKAAMLLVSLVCYVVAAWYGYAAWSSNGHALYWLLIVICILLVTAHCFMYTFEEGIITDAAMCSAGSLLMLYVFYTNLAYTRQPLLVPHNWHREDILNFSSIHLLYKMTTYNFGQAHLSIQFLMRMLYPSHIVLFLLRMYSIICSLLQLVNRYMVEWSEADISLAERVVRSRAAASVLVVFVYSQSLITHLHSHAHTSLAATHYLSATTLIQSIALPIVYMYHLYKVEVNGWDVEEKSKIY